MEAEHFPGRYNIPLVEHTFAIASTYLDSQFSIQQKVLEQLNQPLFGMAYRTYQRFLIIKKVATSLGLSISHPARYTRIWLPTSTLSSITLSLDHVIRWAGVSSQRTFDNHKGFFLRLEGMVTTSHRERGQDSETLDSLQLLRRCPSNHFTDDTWPEELQWSLEYLKSRVP